MAEISCFAMKAGGGGGERGRCRQGSSVEVGVGQEHCFVLAGVLGVSES